MWPEGSQLHGLGDNCLPHINFIAQNQSTWEEGQTLLTNKSTYLMLIKPTGFLHLKKRKRRGS